MPHHRNGAEMANIVLQHTEQPEVIALAQAIVNSQASEIAFMQSLLQAKGFPTVPDEKQPMHHVP